MATRLELLKEREVPSIDGDALGSFEVADLLVAYLEQIGTEYVFGIPGGAIEPIYNALARSGRRGGLRAVVARHEAGAAFMADGYARETGRLGVCIATSGSGATNLITGVACAHDNKVPLLAISGLPALPSFGKNALQESSCIGVNATAMFRHCTHYNSLVSHADQIERKLVNAVMTAMHSTGAAHLAIPLDIQRSAATSATPAYDLAKLLARKPSLIDEPAIQSLLHDLGAAKRIGFLIGSACNEAIEGIMQLVERTGALFVTTPDAKGLIDPWHRAYRGVFGFGGHISADDMLAGNLDLVLAFGTGFTELIGGARCDTLLGEKLIHIDSSEENLLRTPMARLHVRGRIRTVCERLVALLDAAAPNVVYPDSLGGRESDDSGVVYHEAAAMDSEATPLKPQRLMKELSLRCPPNTRFLADIGNSMVWAAHYLSVHDRRSGRNRRDPGVEDRRSGTASWLRMVMDFCPMGWAIGAAVGIARGNPRCPVVCITGDGAYLMSGQEITVAAQEGLPVVFVVLNDAAFGMVKHGQRLAKVERIGTDLPRIDYRKLAEAMGIPGYVIESPADFAAIDFEAILRRAGPTMLDVRIDPEEVPPISLRMKALGTMK